MATSRGASGSDRRCALWRGSAFLLVVASAIPFVAADGAISSGPTMHRIQAGTPGKDGWYEAKSTEGSFTVSLPIPFNDATIKHKLQNGKDLAAFVIAGTSKEGVKFATTEMSDKGKDGDNALLKEFVDGFRKRRGNTISKERYFKTSGNPAVEFKLSTDTSRTFVRQIVLPDRFILMMVDYPAEAEETTLPLIERFFESLQIRKKP